MYAITQTGYRAITEEMDLQPGETLSQEIPQELLQAIEVERGRVRRTDLLRSTDWTQANDSSLTAAQRTEWLAYRQQLRDLPNMIGFPDCQWPAAPVLPQGAAGGGIKVPGPSP